MEIPKNLNEVIEHAKKIVRLGEDYSNGGGTTSYWIMVQNHIDAIGEYSKWNQRGGTDAEMS